MHRKHLFLLFVLAAFATAACDSAPLSPDENAAPIGADALAEKKGDKPNKGNKPTADEPEPEPAPVYAWYQVSAYVDADPLYRFGIDSELGVILLESDPTVASWGTDYWGTWSEPFPFDGQSLTYTSGLNHTTYVFDARRDGGFDVTKTLVSDPYLGGESTTTTTVVGTFQPAG